MNNFSYMDTLRAAFASCLPRFSRPKPIDSNDNARSDARTQRSPSSELEGLLYDTDTEAETLSLHSNIGAGRRRRRKRPAFSLTLFGYTLFGRPPIYLEDDEDEQARSSRALGPVSSSTLDSDAAPLDALTIARLSSPVRMEPVQQRGEEEAHRKAERKARRKEQREGERMSMMLSLNGRSLSEADEFEGFQGSGDFPLPTHPAAKSGSSVDRQGAFPVTRISDACSDDADDADLGGEFYTRKKRASAVWSGSSSDTHSRTSASLSNGDQSLHHHHPLTRVSAAATHPPSYPQTEMQLPQLAKMKKRRTSKRNSLLSSSTASQSTTPHTPAQSVLSESPVVAAFPLPHPRMGHGVEQEDQRRFPSAGLSGPRGKTRDMGAFLANREVSQL